MNDNTPGLDGHHCPTGFTGRTLTSVRAEMAQTGRNESALVSTSPATYSRSDAPVSREFLAHQHRQQARAEASVWYDHGTAAPIVSGNVHSDHNPEGFLAAHGFRATNAQGEEVALTPRQARGLIGRYMDSLLRGGNESVSFRDDSLPPARATVFLRRR
jgi:hypothetical protein